VLGHIECWKHTRERVERAERPGRRLARCIRLLAHITAAIIVNQGAQPHHYEKERQLRHLRCCWSGRYSVNNQYIINS
jgi:hypothetical protein